MNIEDEKNFLIGIEHSLLNARPIYKPFKYPWAYDAWLMQQQIHWLPEEVPMSDDVKDWKVNLLPEEKHFLTQIFRFFVQSDIEVNNCYMRKYALIFKPTEICMMLTAFSNMETIHIAAYAHLLDTVDMPDIEYQAFLKYKEMRDKYEYLQAFNVDTKFDIALTMAVFGAFTEGLQLFASFAMLLNFQRVGKMKGMGQIVTWSVRDESLHTASIIKLYHTFLDENPEIDREKLEQKIVEACKAIVELEDNFIDGAFRDERMGSYALPGLEAFEIKNYIRYMANFRLKQLKIERLFPLHLENPLRWLEEILNGIEFANFFENRVTEYSKAATTGEWNEAFN